MQPFPAISEIKQLVFDNIRLKASEIDEINKELNNGWILIDITYTSDTMRADVWHYKKTI